MNANFFACVSTENGSVLNEGDFKTLRVCGDRSSTTRDAAANYDKIELFGSYIEIDSAGLNIFPFDKLCSFVWRDVIFYRSKINAIASAIESRSTM